MSDIAIQGTVSGTVQGVFFRKNTKSEADDRGITGWVKNLPDGRVAFLLCGPEAEVTAMLEWLKQGPPRSHVDTVESERVSWQDLDGFSIEP